MDLEDAVLQDDASDDHQNQQRHSHEPAEQLDLLANAPLAEHGHGVVRCWVGVILELGVRLGGRRHA